MSGPQFAHIQTFSRKPNPAGQSVDQVLKEARRDPEFSKHVESPEPPELLFGVGLNELELRHEAMCRAATIEVRLKGGKTARRGVRKDRHTLMTHVSSYPLTRTQTADDPEELARVKLWQELEVNRLQRLYGANLQTVIVHTDEEHPHIHAYVLPLDVLGIDATELHPGKAAKRAAEAAGKAEGFEPRAAVAAGNAAYKDAMRQFQDDYFAEVGAPAGLTRSGPKRARKSRRQWREERAEARAASLYDRQKLAAEAAADRKAAAVEREEGQQIIEDHAMLAAEAAAAVVCGDIYRGSDGRMKIAMDAPSLERIRPVLKAVRPALEKILAWWDSARRRVEALPDPEQVKRELSRIERQPTLSPKQPSEEPGGPGF